MNDTNELTRQMVQDIGEYHVCCVLSQLGIRAVRTTQNAMGVDILAYSEKTLRPVTIQVKAARQPVTAEVCPRKLKSPEGETPKALGRLHKRAHEDPAADEHPVARFWALVELRPDDSGKVKHTHVWNSKDKELLRARNVKRGRAGNPAWWIATSIKGQREHWEKRKDGWGQVVDFLNTPLGSGE